ncbi:hypothetical protein H5410_039407 [Solanum commersonii]|uniref:Uncharacterized protein n=1 Tax=Solanum commersonii TaxID=4109 RepID=A0A9J5XM10_SOLCO|nr:hypothetical protein H5410_039407 [Solanum commersonii]
MGTLGLNADSPTNRFWFPSITVALSSLSIVLAPTVRIHGASFDMIPLDGPSLLAEQLTRIPLFAALYAPSGGGIPSSLNEGWSGISPGSLALDGLTCPAPMAKMLAGRSLSSKKGSLARFSVLAVVMIADLIAAGDQVGCVLFSDAATPLRMVRGNPGVQDSNDHTFSIVGIPPQANVLMQSKKTRSGGGIPLSLNEGWSGAIPVSKTPMITPFP